MRMQENEYYLMHKDIPVCLMEISDDGALRNVRRNAGAAEHFPVGGQMNDMKFHDWWQNRAIPRTRHGAATELRRLFECKCERLRAFQNGKDIWKRSY